MQPYYGEVYTILTDEGKAVHTTLDQLFLTANGFFLKAADLSIGQEIYGAGKVTGIVHSGERKVYDFASTGKNLFYANGFAANGYTAKG